MKSYLLVIPLALWAVLVDAGQLISTYNHLVSPQVIIPQTYTSTSFGLVHPQYFSSLVSQGDVLAHPTVVKTSIQESGIPSELKKSNNFYENPYVASALAKESLPYNKETVVYDRPSEKIPRHEIVKLINSLYRVHHDSKLIIFNLRNIDF